ncbi:hypothetical protein LRP30_21740 [Bradyrhizobium sp. C-145]|uniref:hypothetical protein n=1 Tax=Bradyrhizobium sp. C-145 TaxID=574727 RepID=UPI00201B892D|nr:hypothetical protein [Bradyrhizobium sp. C-145]UQR67713.1 hypothetical protein LRP30_21740 [Bradyrhizobium sp. C-145]
MAAQAAAAVAVSKPVPVDPVIPPDASGAAARLNELRGDPAWLNEYLGGSVRHAKEMRDLRAVIDRGGNPDVDRAIAGVLDDAPIQTSKRMTMIGTAEMLRERGVSDTGVIRQVLAGDSVTPQEHAAAMETKARLMNDQAFVARYTAGDGEAKRQMTLLNVIISSSIKVAAA